MDHFGLVRPEYLGTPLKVVQFDRSYGVPLRLLFIPVENTSSWWFRTSIPLDSVEISPEIPWRVRTSISMETTLSNSHESLEEVLWNSQKLIIIISNIYSAIH